MQYKIEQVGHLYQVRYWDEDKQAYQRLKNLAGKILEFRNLGQAFSYIWFERTTPITVTVNEPFPGAESNQ